MSSTSSSPPDASNVVHGVFPTQALRVGDGRRLTPERLPEEATRGVEKGGAAAAETSGERDTGPPAEEAQASFAFIAGDEKGRSSELSQGPSPVADVLLHAAQATVGEVMTAPQVNVLASNPLKQDGRATDAVVLPQGAPPEEATPPRAAGTEPYAHEGTADEAAIEGRTTREIPGEELAGEAAAPAAGPREVDRPEVYPREFDPPEIDPPVIDPPEVAPHQEALHEGAAQAIPDEEVSGEAASREGAQEDGAR